MLFSHHGEDNMFSREISPGILLVFIQYNVVFHSVQVTLRGNRLEFKNVRYPGEIGIYQCVAENPHGMIVSSTYVKVLRKHLENYI